MTTYNDNNNNDCPPPPEAEEAPKRKVGRPRRDPDIVVALQKDYYKNHYHEKRKIRIQCPVCSQMTTKNAQYHHRKSMKCRLVGLQNEKLEL